MTTTTSKTVTELKRSQKLFILPVRRGKTNHSIERCYVGANATNRPLPWKRKPEEQSGHFQQDAQNSITGCVLAAAQHPN